MFAPQVAESLTLRYNKTYLEGRRKALGTY